MNGLLDMFPRRAASLERPTFWTAVAVSVLLHVLLLGKWLPQVQIRLPSLEEIEKEETSRSLVVQLAPPAAPAPAPPPAHAPRLQLAPTLRAPASVAARPRPAPPPPPVMALDNRAPNAPAPPPVTAPPVAPTPPAPTSDLSSYIEAQRRARMASASPSLFSQSAGRAPAPPVEDDAARGDRAIAANLGLNRAPSFGPDATKHGGGIFQIQRMGYSDAEFLFYGWNRDIRRNSTQRIEVTKGDAPNIQIAVVRRMIVIIRDHESGDFTWVSRRLGRDVVLSARAKDNAGLEDFMLQEFFFDNRLPR